MTKQILDESYWSLNVHVDTEDAIIQKVEDVTVMFSSTRANVVSGTCHMMKKISAVVMIFVSIFQQFNIFI